MWTTTIDRDAHGHLRHVQVWTSIQPAGTVHLYFAHHAGIQLGGQDIPDVNNFFFKHFLLPSKSGKTMQQKGESRVDHRFGAKQLALKVASARPRGKRGRSARPTSPPSSSRGWPVRPTSRPCPVAPPLGTPCANRYSRR